MTTFCERLRRRHRDIGNAFCLEPQKLKFDPFVDKASPPAGEQFGVGNKGHQHAGRELLIQNGESSQPDDDDSLRSKKQVVERFKTSSDPLNREIAVCDTDRHVREAADSFRLGIGKFDRLDSANGLH